MKLIAKMFLVSSVAYVLNANASEWGQNCDLNKTGDCDGIIYVQNNAGVHLYVNIYNKNATNATNATIARLSLNNLDVGKYGWKGDGNAPSGGIGLYQSKDTIVFSPSASEISDCIKGDGRYQFIINYGIYSCQIRQAQ